MSHGKKTTMWDLKLCLKGRKPSLSTPLNSSQSPKRHKKMKKPKNNFAVSIFNRNFAPAFEAIPEIR
jgi:hypothetical protein